MIEVELRAVEDMYAAASSGFKGTVAFFPLNSFPVESITTVLLGGLGNDKYHLETLISPVFNADNDHFKVPNKLMAKELENDYAVYSSNPHQMILNTENNEFILDKRVSYDKSMPISMRLKNTITTACEFENALKDYAVVLQSLIENIYKSYAMKQVNAPDIKYLIGEQLVLNQKANQDPPGSQQSQHPSLQAKVDLDSLEKRFEIPNPNVSFDDIIGVDKLKAECYRIVRDIKDPARSVFFGRDAGKQKNLLISGEKGGGKTMSVAALATLLKKELPGKVKFYRVDYSSITSIFRGGEAQATAAVFDLIERNEKKGFTTVAFFDEAHQIGVRKREFNEALDVMLTKLDGMKKYKNTIIIESTYAPLEYFDEALVDRHKPVIVDPLTTEQKTELFKRTVKKKNNLAKSIGKDHKLFGRMNYKKIAPELQKLNGRGIGSEHGIVEAVVEWKDDHTPILSEFGPITTSEVLEVLRTFRPANGIVMPDEYHVQQFQTTSLTDIIKQQKFAKEVQKDMRNPF